MKHWIRASFVRGLHELVRTIGGEHLERNVFGASPLSRAVVADPYEPMDFHLVSAIYDSMLLNLGSIQELFDLNARTGAFDPYGIAHLASAQAQSRTVIEYWARLQSFMRFIIGGWQPSMVRLDELVTIQSNWRRNPGVGFAVICCLMLVRRIRDLSGAMPVEVRMPLLPSPWLRARIGEELPDVPMTFHKERHGLTYRRADLLASALPEITWDRVTFRDIVGTYASPKGKDVAVDIVTEAVKMLLRGDEPTLELVASRCELHPRSVQRLLASGGFTIRSLVERLRVMRASHLLAETDEPILDIALATGYNSHQALDRAFARWRGLSPKEFRHYTVMNRPVSLAVNQ